MTVRHVDETSCHCHCHCHCALLALVLRAPIALRKTRLKASSVVGDVSKGGEGIAIGVNQSMNANTLNEDRKGCSVASLSPWNQSLLYVDEG